MVNHRQNAHELGSLARMLSHGVGLPTGVPSSLYEQFAQPIQDREQALRDAQVAQEQQAAADQQAQLSSLQGALMQNAIDQGTMTGPQVNHLADGFGADPQQASQLAGMIAGGGGGGVSAESADDLAANAQVIQAAASGIPPLQIGSDAPGTGQPVPKQVVLSQVQNMMLAQGKSPEAIATVLSHLSEGYRYP